MKIDIVSNHVIGNSRLIFAIEKVMPYNPRIIETRLEYVSPGFVKFCRQNNLKIMVNALEKGAENKYQEIIDSPIDMVNLDKADLMINLIK